MTREEEQLRDAAERLYAVFAHYRGKPGWSDFLDNMPEEDERSVARQSVRDLSEFRYRYYAWHAVTVNEATTEALKYFAPRVLVSAALPVETEVNELPGQPAATKIDVELYVELMCRLGWQQWPEEEVAAITGFFDAWFNAALRWPPQPWRSERMPDKVLEYMAYARLDAGAVVRKWLHHPAEEATVHLASFVASNGNELAQHATLWRQVWSHGVEEQIVQHVAKVLISRQTKGRLEAAFFAEANESNRAQLSSAMDMLDAIASAWRNQAGTPGFPAWTTPIAQRYLAENA